MASARRAQGQQMERLISRCRRPEWCHSAGILLANGIPHGFGGKPTDIPAFWIDRSWSLVSRVRGCHAPGPPGWFQQLRIARLAADRRRDLGRRQRVRRWMGKRLPAASRVGAAAAARPTTAAVADDGYHGSCRTA
jgi:hypothetical protein